MLANVCVNLFSRIRNRTDVYIHSELVRYMPVKKIIREKNLLSSSDDELAEVEVEVDVSRNQHTLKHLVYSILGPGQDTSLDPVLVYQPHFNGPAIF